jgi:hypothetical protein
LPARGNEPTREGNPGVITAQLCRVQHLAVTFDCSEVPARDRTCERRGWSEPADVVKSAPGKRQEGFEGKPDGCGHALNLAEECDEMVGRHAGCSVVPGP